MIDKPLILVVDGDPEERTRLYSILARGGRDVATADTGLSALKDVVRRHPDLVLSEVELPDLAASQFLEQLRRVSLHPRVIFTSRRKGQARSAEALEAAGEEVLRGPCRETDVIGAVDRALRPHLS